MEKNGRAWVTTALRLSLEIKYANDHIDWLKHENWIIWRYRADCFNRILWQRREGSGAQSASFSPFWVTAGCLEVIPWFLCPRPWWFPLNTSQKFLTDWELLSGKLCWMEVWLRGVSDHMQKGAKTFFKLRVWFWYRILVNYCPLVFNFCLMLGIPCLHSKLSLTGDVDPLFWGVTVHLTCVSKH